MHATAPRRTQDRTGFCSSPTRGREKNWRVQWDRLVDQVSESDPLTLYRAVEEGVPADTVMLLSKALGEPAPQVLVVLGLPETTFRRKVEAGEALPEVAGHRAVALMRVAAQLRQLLAESGDPDRVKDFDLGAWISAWIKEPLPEFGGETPAALLRNPEGQRVVETLPRPLPVGWDVIPEGRVSRRLGSAWLAGGTSALLCAPSVIVEEEDNVLVNPKHADAARLGVTRVRRFRYDPRV